MTTWRPHKGAQEKFHVCGAFEALYGGAAGGGKTDSLLMEGARQIDKKTYKGLLLRRTYPELETSLIMRAFQWYPSMGGKQKDSGKLWTFPSGATIRFGHIEHDKDVYKYQSAEFDFIGFDELTTFTEFQYLYLFSRCRGTDPNVIRYVRGATNPGNIGHVWVKQRFVDNKEPYKVYKNGSITRAFIPARVWDNPTLLKHDPLYIERLKLLPENQQRMLLDGDWNVFEGQYFSEWREERHVVKPFPIPETWYKFRAIDYGRSAPFCCKWYAVDYDGNVWVYREYYEVNKIASMNAQAVADLSTGEKYRYTVADPSIFNKTHLPESIADVMARYGVPCIKGGNDRTAGWNSMREYLYWDEHKDPKIRYFKTCVNSIRTIPQLIHDPRRPEDLDTTGEDHAADTDRYFLQTLRQRKSAKPDNPVLEKIKQLQATPLDISTDFYANRTS